MNDEILLKVWDIEIEILEQFHLFCIKNNLRYTLAYGTLIGAIRHKGFIPWDDDIDVMMPREDYEKMLKLWSEEVSDQYVLQDYNSDDDYTNNFAKIRKNNTTFIQSEDEKQKKYHKGIFIDVFPGDRIPNNFILKKIVYIASAVNLLYSRKFCSGLNGLIGVIEKILLKTNKTNFSKRRNYAEKIMKHWNKNTELKFVFPCTIQCCKKYLPSDMFENLKIANFENREFYITKNYDEILRNEYGNYMLFPPENEQKWKHHPILIDFKNNYEDIK